MLILYFLVLRNSLPSLVHIICALEDSRNFYDTSRIELQRIIKNLTIRFNRGSLLIEFFNRTSNLDERRPLKNPCYTADLQIYLLVQVRLIVRGILTEYDRLDVHVHLMARLRVARLFGGWLLRRAFIFFPSLFPTQCHYLLAGHVTSLYPASATFGTLRIIEFRQRETQCGDGRAVVLYLSLSFTRTHARTHTQTI